MEKKTKKAMCQGQKDSGVSPVVGVMLMLVVTIVIAAIVASFASGLGTSSSEAPVSTLDVSLYPGTAAKTAVIENIAGDALETKDLLITVSYTLPLKYNNGALAHGGQTIIHSIDGSIEPIPENDLNTTADNYPFDYQTTNNDDVVSTRVNSEKLFGQAELVSGSRIVFDIDYFAGFDTGAAPATYGFAASSSVLHVTIVHKPSSTVLFDKDVRMS